MFLLPTTHRLHRDMAILLYFWALLRLSVAYAGRVFPGFSQRFQKTAAKKTAYKARFARVTPSLLLIETRMKGKQAPYLFKSSNYSQGDPELVGPARAGRGRPRDEAQPRINHLPFPVFCSLLSVAMLLLTPPPPTPD